MYIAARSNGRRASESRQHSHSPDRCCTHPCGRRPAPPCNQPAAPGSRRPGTPVCRGPRRQRCMCGTAHRRPPRSCPRRCRRSRISAMSFDARCRRPRRSLRSRTRPCRSQTPARTAHRSHRCFRLLRETERLKLLMVMDDDDDDVYVHTVAGLTFSWMELYLTRIAIVTSPSSSIPSAGSRMMKSSSPSNLSATISLAS